MSADIPVPYHRPAEAGLVRRLWYAGAPYQAMLSARAPRQLLFIPPDPWPGSAARGTAIIDGGIAFGHPPAVGAPILTVDPHGFSWLRDLRAAGSESGRRRGRELIRDWIEHFGRYDREAWRPDLLAERIVNWLAQYDHFVGGADESLRDAFLRSLIRQARHLAGVFRGTTRGAARIHAAKAMIYAGACLPGGSTWLDKGLDLLEAEASNRIYPDGGVYERCPSVQMTVLRDLVDVANVLHAAHREPSFLLQQAIDRTAPLVRFFQMGDGGLALFNDGFEEEGWVVDFVLDRSGAKGKAPASAPHSGFQRLFAGRTTILFDGGGPPPAGLDTRAHAGTFSFEMSVGKARLIVNCGGFFGQANAWRDAVRQSAAHSTLVVGDTNSAEVLPGGGIGRRPGSVTCRRQEADGNTWIDARHDGYAVPYGLVHQRRLYLAKDGLDLRGEDRLMPAEEGRVRAVPFAVRFHLHPDTTLEQLQRWESGAQFIDFHREGTGRWRLHCDKAVELMIENSSYLGRPGEVRQSRQIVLTGTTGGTEETVIRWAIRRAQ